MEHAPFVSTGLAGLDRALGDIMRPGNVIGVISGTGGGKTVLATQIIRHSLSHLPGEQILLLSTEATAQEFWLRNLAASLSIPYSEATGKNDHLIEDGKKHLWPNPSIHGLDAVKKAKYLRQQFYQLNHVPILTANADLPTQITESLADFQNSLKGLPGLVVIDYLNKPSHEIEEWKARQTMQDSMAAIRDAASQGNLLIVVFAQATLTSIGKRHLGPQDIADCKNLFVTADAFAAISQEYGSDPRDEGESGPQPMYRNSQTIMVSLSSPAGIPVRVPVTRRFEFQRFEDREETYNDPFGYLPFSRERFRELCVLPLKTCINVYLFLVFWSRSGSNDKNSGKTWPSQIRISEATGLTEKQVRTAIERLEENGLIRKKATASTNRYTIVDWKAHHDVAGAAELRKTYVRLSRGLLKNTGKEIFSEPALLRLWIYIIINTRMFQDKKHWELHRGHFEIDYDDVEHEIGLRREECCKQLSILEERGSIERVDGVNLKILYRVTNWDRFQPDV